MTLAHFQGDRSIPLVDDSIGVFLRNVGAAQPAAEALADLAGGLRWDYGRFQADVDATARAMIAAGVRRGDRVAMWSPNRAESVVVQCAVASIGAILVGVNPAGTADELEYVLRHSGAAIAVAAESYRDRDQRAVLEAVRGRGWSGRPIIMDSAEWSAFVDAGQDVGRDLLSAREQSVVADDPFCLQYTSGTTGRPKAATITHRAALNNALFIGRALRLSARDRLCVCLPFFHAFGIIACNLATLTHGGAVVVSGPAFSAERVLAAVESERCTVLHGVPTMFIAELAHPDFARFDLSSLRTGLMGGAQCPLDVVERVMRDMGLTELTVGFGMSELSSVTTQTTWTDSLERQVSTVGRVHPHMEVRVTDGRGATAEVDVAGELVVRGYARMAGYWNDPDATARAIDADGWLHSGDLATIDAEGFVSIVGRLKDMIIRGGENIYPIEIEEVLHRLDDVVDAHVVGVPDPVYGEQVVAAVQLRRGSVLTAEAVIQHCRTVLARYKVPHAVVFCDSFPATPSGKVRKNVLREELAKAVPTQA
jgi:fatty-acyl-CoA synthase